MNGHDFTSFRVGMPGISMPGRNHPETGESTRLHVKCLDRDGAGHPKEEGTHDADRA